MCHFSPYLGLAVLCGFHCWTGGTILPPLPPPSYVLHLAWHSIDDYCCCQAWQCQPLHAVLWACIVSACSAALPCLGDSKEVFALPTPWLLQDGGFFDVGVALCCLPADALQHPVHCSHCLKLWSMFSCGHDASLLQEHPSVLRFPCPCAGLGTLQLALLTAHNVNISITSKAN